MAPRRREWRSAVDPNSGRTYYYDTISRETQWRKPVDLASFAERRKIQEKEAKQREFFRSMEANILQAMDKGKIPGEHAQTRCEDVVKPLLPKNTVTSSRKKPKKPTLIRTISSMDDELIAELAQGLDAGEAANGNVSPDSTSTSFFDSLPQPGTQQHFSSKMNTSPPLTGTSDTLRALALSRTIAPPRHEVSKDLPKPTMGKRNTCGSLFISNTMADPDKDAAIKVRLDLGNFSQIHKILTRAQLFFMYLFLKCLCGVFRTHIVQSTKEQPSQNVFEEYEVFNDDYQDHQFPQQALIMEGLEAIELMRIDTDDGVPSLDDISHFYRFVFKKAQMESDCIIMSLIYVERLLRETNCGVRPNVNNWRSVLFSCMVLSSKVWDDLSMWNNDFSQALPEGIKFSLQRINQLELALLTCLKYNVKVPASEYAKYYFLMRSMMIRSGLAGQEILSSSPLDVNRARQLEFLSSNYNDKNNSSKLRRSRSVDGLATERDSPSPTRSSQVNLEQVVRM
jgi:hypothetical protein